MMRNQCSYQPISLFKRVDNQNLWSHYEISQLSQLLCGKHVYNGMSWTNVRKRDGVRSGWDFFCCCMNRVFYIKVILVNNYHNYSLSGAIMYVYFYSNVQYVLMLVFYENVYPKFNNDYFLHIYNYINWRVKLSDFVHDKLCIAFDIRDTLKEYGR